MLDAAVVGLGWWGKHIVESLKNSNRIRIIAGVDQNPDTVAEFAAQRKLRLTDQYQEILSDDGIDAVIIATPHGFHEQQVLEAAYANKQIFCEKPLTLTSDAARRMLGACEKYDLILGIGHERRYEGAFEELKKRVDSNELGTLLRFEINASYNLFANYSASDWRLSAEHSPAATMTALGVHLTDYLQTILGRAKEASAKLVRRSENYAGQDVLTVDLRFSSGISGSFCTMATTPFYQRISLFGDRSWVEIREESNVNEPEPTLMLSRGIENKITTRVFEKTNTVRKNLHAWADAVEGKGAYRFTSDELLHNVQILEAIVNSAAKGTPCMIGEQ